MQNFSLHIQFNEGMPEYLRDETENKSGLNDYNHIVNYGRHAALSLLESRLTKKELESIKYMGFFKRPMFECGGYNIPFDTDVIILAYCRWLLENNIPFGESTKFTDTQRLEYALTRTNLDLVLYKNVYGDELLKGAKREEARQTGLDKINAEKSEQEQEAIHLANNIWETDNSKAIRIGDMAKRVKEKLSISEKEETIKNWLRPIAPAYAQKKGRPRNK